MLRARSRTWALQVLLLLGAAVFAFFGLYSIDVLWWQPRPGSVHPPSAVGPLAHYLNFDPRALSDAISELAGTMLAVFGIVITVVSIIVQLSADRYAGVARRFLRDRVNLGVLAFYVIASVFGVWLGVAVQEEFVPWRTVFAMLCATAFGLVLMAPYFGYVFWFLEPANVIGRIEMEATEFVERVSKRGDEASVSEAQLSALEALEELTDIASSSVVKKDKLVASHALDAIRDFTLSYMDGKANLPKAWFSVDGALAENPDFVAMDPESLFDLEDRRCWLEWKALRQYLRVFSDTSHAMRDLHYLVAINTRYVGERAADIGDDALLQVVLRYMNSYLRVTLNARDVRTAYNVMNQYRLLTEALIRGGREETAAEIVCRMKYYGHLAFDMKLPFITETIAYDIAALCEVSRTEGARVESTLLEAFLELDRPHHDLSQERALMGVRKAQVVLATFYLARGDADKARLIADDMKAEPKRRLLQIQEQLSQVTHKDFWEVIDRGRNFEYLEPERRAKLPEFFQWLPGASG